MEFQMMPSLPASDIGRAKAWYERVLGVTPEMEDEDGSLVYMAGGSAFMVYESQFAGTNQATAAGVVVQDFDAATAALRAAGVAFEEYDFGDEFRTVDGVMTDDAGRRMAWFRDSEGNILGLAENPM
jgi:predicted enzyme related to lactoylglutathione lyase